MSYDFRLFRKKDGEDPKATAQRVTEELPTTAPDPEKERLKRKIADALIAHDPKLEIFKFDYAEIAKFEKISVEQARLRYRHLELNGPENDSNGIQITLFDDEAAVTVPFWHEGDRAAETFREIWNYLEIISREGGYLIYDPQIDRVFEASGSFDDALAAYTGTSQKIGNLVRMSNGQQKPFGKLLWFGLIGIIAVIISAVIFRMMRMNRR